MKTALDYTNDAITRSNEIRNGAPLTPEEELSKRLMDHLTEGNSTDGLQDIFNQWVKEQVVVDQHAPYDLEVFALTMRDMPDYWNAYGHTPPEVRAYGLAAMRAAQIVEARKKPSHDNHPAPEDEDQSQWKFGLSQFKMEG